MYVQSLEEEENTTRIIDAFMWYREKINQKKIDSSRMYGFFFRFCFSWLNPKRNCFFSCPNLEMKTIEKNIFYCIRTNTVYCQTSYRSNWIKKYEKKHVFDIFFRCCNDVVEWPIKILLNPSVVFLKLCLCVCLWHNRSTKSATKKKNSQYQNLSISLSCLSSYEMILYILLKCSTKKITKHHYYRKEINFQWHLIYFFFQMIIMLLSLLNVFSVLLLLLLPTYKLFLTFFINGNASSMRSRSPCDMDKWIYQI